MPTGFLDCYMEASSVLEAQELLRALKVQDWPNMKNGARNEFHRELKKPASTNFASRKVVSSEGMAQTIKGIFSG